MIPPNSDRLRGMILLSAYGDAFGAKHESIGSIHPEPLPTRLPQREINGVNEWGTWVAPDALPEPAIGIPTDDTAFKLFILHPWLKQILDQRANFSEASFRQFIHQLKSQTVKPVWVFEPRNNQIQSWLEMYEASELSKTSWFFQPGVPVVFGFFLFLETAAFRVQYEPLQNYLYVRNCTVLDQGYGKAASGFLTSLASLAFSSDQTERFDHWLVRESEALIRDLLAENIDHAEIKIIESIILTMNNLGKTQRGRSSHDFMVAFEKAVIEPDHPPFMDMPFKGSIFDPFRMLAEIYSASAYAEGDPFRAIQPLAFSSGDTDTVTSFLGTLMGIWYGETMLRDNSNLVNDLDIIENVLRDTFEVDLKKRIDLFLRLQSREVPHLLS